MWGSVKGLRFVGKNPTVVLQSSRFDVPRVLCYIAVYKLFLPSTVRIDHFLDTRIIKFAAINCVVLTSLKLWRKDLNTP